MNVYEIYKAVISTGNFIVSEMEERIETVYAAGKITAEQRTELLIMADEYAKDSVQVDIVSMLADLEARVAKLEAKGVVVWTTGHATSKGETVLYDVDKDGKLDYCRYDGGKASTVLSPGKISGWVVLDAEGGQIIATLEKDDEGKVIIVPVTTPEA